MKPIKHISLFGALLIALVSCSKSNNNSNNNPLTPGSVGFAIGGQSVKMTGTITYGASSNYFVFTAVGVLPGAPAGDTAQFNISIPNVGGANPPTTINGTYSDTASNFSNYASFALVDVGTQTAYEDYKPSNKPFTFVINSNSSSTITATFSGMVSTGSDSLMVSNGQLTVTY